VGGVISHPCHRPNPVSPPTNWRLVRWFGG